MPQSFDAVARFAIEPFATTGDRPAWRIVRTGWCTIGFSPSPLLTFVDGIRAEGDIPAKVDEVRDHLRRAGRRSAYWMTSPLSEPAGLVEELRGLGLSAPTDGPLQETGAAMVLDRPPDTALPDDVTADVLVEPDEIIEALRILAATNGVPEDHIDAAANALATSVDSTTTSAVVARIDGNPVAAATAVKTPHGIWLTGGGTLPVARGRGAYRALVEARWRQAVEAGTPALVVQAGAMSRPLLERMGFRTVATVTVLRDEMA